MIQAASQVGVSMLLLTYFNTNFLALTRRVEYALAPPPRLPNGTVCSLRRVSSLCHRHSRDMTALLLANPSNFVVILEY